MINSVGLSGFGCERLIQPGETLRAQAATAFSRYDRVQRHDSQRPVVDDVLDERLPLVQIIMIRERASHCCTVVTVAGYQVHRHR